MATVAALASTVRTRRYAAAFLDMALALVLALVPAALAPGVWKGRAYGLGLLLGALYVLFRDGIPYGEWGARSLGKRWLGVRPYRTDGAPMDWATSARRNATVATALAIPSLVYLVSGFKGIPFDGVLLAGSALLLVAEVVLVGIDPVARRVGDRIAHTRVVEARA